MLDSLALSFLIPANMTGNLPAYTTLTHVTAIAYPQVEDYRKATVAYSHKPWNVVVSTRANNAPAASAFRSLLLCFADLTCKRLRRFNR